MDAIVYDKVGKEAEKVREALYGLYPQETITDAAVASFDDGADSMPVRKLVAQIEPVQDLHGYDHPWPAGGGKNLFDKDNVTKLNAYIDGSISLSSGQRMVYIPCKPNTTYTAQKIAVAGDTADRFAFAYTTTVPANGVTVYEQRVRPTPTTIGQKLSLTITTGADAQYLVLWISQSEGYDASLLTTMIAEESSASDYSPYSNICPISGWTGAEIEHTGKNLAKAFYRCYFYSQNQTPVFDNDSESILFYAKQGETYIISSTPTPNRSILALVGVENVAAQTPIMSCSSASGGIWVAKWTGWTLWYGYDSKSTDFEETAQVELGSTATDYEPYTGDQISVTFPSEAGTVYGGTLTLNPDRTGTLVVDMAIADLGTLSWGKITAGGYDFYQTDDLKSMIKPPIDSRTKANCISTIFTVVPWLGDDRGSGLLAVAGTSDNVAGRISCQLSGVSTAEEFKAAVSGALLCYELAEPQAYQLTAEQISGILSTLYGTNNIWADTGNIEKLTYRADLGKYIDSHITTAVADALNA